MCLEIKVWPFPVPYQCTTSDPLPAESQSYRCRLGQSWCGGTRGSSPRCWLHSCSQSPSLSLEKAAWLGSCGTHLHTPLAPACPQCRAPASSWHCLPAEEGDLQEERMEIAQHRGHCWAGKWGIKRNLWISRSLLGMESWSRLWTISGMNRLRMKLLPLLPSSSVCCQPKVGSASEQSCSGAREKWEQQSTAK